MAISISQPTGFSKRRFGDEPRIAARRFQFYDQMMRTNVSAVRGGPMSRLEYGQAAANLIAAHAVASEALPLCLTSERELGESDRRSYRPTPGSPVPAESVDNSYERNREH